MIAESIIGAANKMDIHVPMVVRLQGTNSEAGLQLVSSG
jgi:succinyl-CoA synthetase beta subunit